MSNSRVFAWGYMLASGLCAFARWSGYGPPWGFVGMVKTALLCLTFGVMAVAFFGDRRSA